MKKYLFAVVCSLVFAGNITDAQTKKYVASLRYWFDSPTPVAPVTVNVSSYNSDSSTASYNGITPDISALSAGTHTIYVSVLDQSGNWGTPAVSRFTIGAIAKQHVTKGRYWFNSPTPVSPVEINPTYGSDSTTATFSNTAIDLSSLSAGTHRLYFSIRDHLGRWGTPAVSIFTIGAIQKNFVTKGQYWFNSPTPVNPVEVDPAYSSDSSSSNFSNLSINVTSLQAGTHALYFRTRDASGRWGAPVRSFFTIGGEQKKYITAGQYWFNNPTPVNAEEFTPSFTGDSTNVTAALSSVEIPDGLPNGKHTLYVRYRDNKGNWGAAQTVQFVQDASLAPPTITQMEYFFGNTDPGQGAATAPRGGSVTGLGGRTVSYVDSFSVELLGLAVGTHKFNTRFKSSKNEWGPTISKSFTVAVRPEMTTSVTDTLRFGKMYSSRDSVTQSFYIKNAGDADLRVRVGTKPSSQWTVRMYDPITQALKDTLVLAKDSFAKDSALVSVMFKPVKFGTIASSIQFLTNDTARPTFLLPVSATADSAIGKLAVTVDTIKFGQRPVSTTTWGHVILSNTGADTIVLTISNSTNPYFVIQPNRSKIAPNNPSDTIKLNVRFSPQFQGTYNNYSFNIGVRNRFNQLIENKAMILTGSAVINNTPTINPSHRSLNFGAISSRAADNKDTTIQLVLENIGTQSLTVKSVVSSDTNVFKTDVPANTQYTLPFVSTLNVGVTFKPTANQFKKFSGTLTVTSTSANEDSVLVIPMDGEGTNGPPLSVFALSDTVLDFGSVTLGYSLSKNITISNTGGNKILTVSSFSIDNTLFSTTQTFPLDVPADSARTFAVKFVPASTGPVTGTISVVTNATNRSFRTVALKGNGVITPMPILETSMNPILFGATKVSTPNAVYFKFKNVGNDTLRADSIFMSKQTSFFTVNKTKVTVAPQQSDSIRVTFTPLAVTTYTDSLVFLSNMNPSRYGIYTTGSGAILSIAIDTNVTPPNPKIVGGNQPMQIGVSLTASLGSNAKAYLFYKLSGATAFDSSQMTTSDGMRFQGVIPANKVGDRGAVYFVKISNGVETISLPQSFVTVEFPGGVTKSQDQPAGTKQTNYRMISVPLSGITSSVDSILKNFGTYDKNKWRLFRYQNGNYVEHHNPSFQSFAPGRGYWFITATPHRIRSGSGTATPANAPFNIDLQSEWNQIGNPFNFPVLWDSVTGKGANVGGLFDYDGTDFVPASILQPWVGYFVKNTSSNPVTINVRPVEPGVPGNLPRSPDVVPFTADGEWMMQLRARSGDAQDNYNFLGVKADASDEFDSYDMVESPRQPGEYLKLQFNNRSWIDAPDQYGYDFRSPNSEGKFWDVQIQSNSTADEVTVSIDRYETIPPHFSIVLVDPDAVAAVDLRAAGTFSLPTTKKEMTKNLRIIVGTKDFVARNNFGIVTVPTEFGLSQNYPNPFNPSTTIRYALPVPSVVSVRVFDMLGKEVRRLVQETQAEGYHFVQWNGKNNEQQTVSSGIYFCRMTARSADGTATFTRTTKMILMK